PLERVLLSKADADLSHVVGRSSLPHGRLARLDGSGSEVPDLQPSGTAAHALEPLLRLGLVVVREPAGPVLSGFPAALEIGAPLGNDRVSRRRLRSGIRRPRCRDPVAARRARSLAPGNDLRDPAAGIRP